MNEPWAVTAFWYRRAMAVGLIIVCVLVAIGLANKFVPQFMPASVMHVSLISVAAAALAGAAIVIGLVSKNDKPLWSLSFTSYVLLLTATAGSIVEATAFNSRLVSVWMIISVFSGLWGMAGIIVSLLGGVGFGVYFFLIQGTELSYAMLFVVAFIVPPVVSYIAMHQRKTSNQDQNMAYHALAQQLSQVANKSEIVINAIGEGVIAVNSTGVIELINPAAQTIMGWGKQDAIGLDYHAVFKLLDEKGAGFGEHGGPIQQVLNGGDSVTSSNLFLATNSGKKMNIWLQVSSIGKFGNGALIVFRDITNEINENKERTEFVSTASHEMRTPVAAIEGYLGLALNPQTAQIDDKARAFITKAHESAQHLGRLFQDLLDVSKAEDGRLKNVPKVVEVVGFVREMTSLMNTPAQAKGLLMVFQPDVAEHTTNMIVPIYHTLADPDHLREVVSNLLDNAIKYTHEGSVTVDVTSHDDKIRIAVTDTGIGIAREDIPHLFQKFYRIDNTETREIGGTGLGLYLCRRLIESMNGRIWVESTQGQGSTFYVELNRLSDEKAREIQTAATSGPKT